MELLEAEEEEGDGIADEVGGGDENHRPRRSPQSLRMTTTLLVLFQTAAIHTTSLYTPITTLRYAKLSQPTAPAFDYHKPRERLSADDLWPPLFAYTGIGPSKQTGLRSTTYRLCSLVPTDKQREIQHDPAKWGNHFREAPQIHSESSVWVVEWRWLSLGQEVGELRPFKDVGGEQSGGHHGLQLFLVLLGLAVGLAHEPQGLLQAALPSLHTHSTEREAMTWSLNSPCVRRMWRMMRRLRKMSKENGMKTWKLSSPSMFHS